MKNLLLLFVSVFLTFTSVLAQDVNITDFETGSPTATPAFNATFEKITNPDQSGLNTTATCGKIGRTTTNWWELVDIPVSFTVPKNTIKYVHVLVKYDAVPVFGVRYNTSSVVNLSNTYASQSLGEWQDLVCEFAAGESDLIVTQIRINADCAKYGQSLATDYVLNNTDQFALIDEIIVNDDSNPRSLPTDIGNISELKNYILTSSNGTISIEKIDDIAEDVFIYNSLGTLVKTVSKTTQLEFNVPTSGIYILKIGNDTEKVFVK